MRASVATILPSSQEGCPRCVMESMSLEVPVIGSDIRGTRDLLSSGAGMLVRVGDVEGIARAMEHTIDNPDDARAMGRVGRQSARGFELSGVLSHHEDLYSLALRIPERVAPVDALAR